MADLTGQTPAATYKGLLQVNDYTDGVDATVKYIQDGEGTDSALAISTDKVGIGTTSSDNKLAVHDTSDPTIELKNSSTNALAGIGVIDEGSTSGSLALKSRLTNGPLLTRVVVKPNGDVTPDTDDAQDLGAAAKRWDDIYATNTTIQASDRELKQDIEELSEAETRVAQACKGLLRKYRWKSSVAEKGDDARIHFGIMAQDLEAAFAAEGLDAGRYGMFIKNTWWEADRVVPAVEAVEAVEAVYDEEGNEVSPAVEAVEAQPERTELDIFNNIEDAPEGATEVTQRGVRYAELLAFIIAAI